jgi:hypothetical protein
MDCATCDGCDGVMPPHRNVPSPSQLVLRSGTLPHDASQAELFASQLKTRAFGQQYNTLTVRAIHRDLKPPDILVATHSGASLSGNISSLLLQKTFVLRRSSNRPIPSVVCASASSRKGMSFRHASGCAENGSFDGEPEKRLSSWKDAKNCDDLNSPDWARSVTGLPIEFERESSPWGAARLRWRKRPRSPS